MSHSPQTAEPAGIFAAVLPSLCTVTTGTAISVTSPATASNIDFALWPAGIAVPISSSSAFLLGACLLALGTLLLGRHRRAGS